MRNTPKANELEATQAKKSGRKAFLKGVQLRQSPIKIIGIRLDYRVE